jgi:hypothetical protein
MKKKPKSYIMSLITNNYLAFSIEVNQINIYNLITKPYPRFILYFNTIKL